MNEIVVIKGKNNILEIVFDKTTAFSLVFDQLKEKLESAAGFFNKNADVKVQCPVHLSTDERDQLSCLLTQYGLSYESVQTPADSWTKHKSQAVSVAKECPILVIEKTLRSGQKVTHDGSVIVRGDVNPGAEVVASGDIMIYGTCRGVVHAGANGNRLATVTATRLMASQLRIATVFTRSPDIVIKSLKSERARILQNTVLIEPVNCF